MGDSSWAAVPKRVCSHLFCWDLLVDPLCLVGMMHFWTLWPFKPFCLDLDRLIGPALVHGSGYRKGHPNLSRLGFWRGAEVGAAHKLVQARNKLVQVKYKLVRVGPQVVQPSF